jgi:hypothetical protein
MKYIDIAVIDYFILSLVEYVYVRVLSNRGDLRETETSRGMMRQSHFSTYEEHLILNG